MTKNLLFIYNKLQKHKPSIKYLFIYFNLNPFQTDLNSVHIKLNKNTFHPIDEDEIQLLSLLFKQ